ncbi:MAG: hypothetical protein B6243_07760 [Anaerolineaceae bacterium 4572_5.2]|nr:MAG: hypothetical protein B6243_07760 [Anaerolineaceae bacterium 4572_5.2]
MKKKLSILALASLLLILNACKPSPPSTSPENAIAAAVAGTLAAQPVPTIQPTYIPYPTYTPYSPDLHGLFCEYAFCIGHPADIALFNATDADNPNTYSNGMLAAYRLPDFFNIIIWQLNHGSDDPQFMLDLVMGFGGQDSHRGNLDVSLIGNLTTFYAPLTVSANKTLPSGGVAAWVCGDRAFGWMVYTPTEEIAYILFQEAMSKFTCAE